MTDAEGNLVHPRKLEIVPHEAEVVRLVWTQLITHSLSEVADAMNREGVQRRTAVPWTREAVKDVWRRGPFYTGQVILKRGLDHRKGTHPAIITKAEYAATVKAVNARKRSGAKPRPYRTYLVRQKAFCSCGARLRGEARVQRGTETRYSRCPNTECGSRLIKADTIETMAIDRISKGVLPAEDIDAARTVLRQRLRSPTTTDTVTKRQRLTARLEALRKQHTGATSRAREFAHRPRRGRERRHRHHVGRPGPTVLRVEVVGVPPRGLGDPPAV